MEETRKNGGREETKKVRKDRGVLNGQRDEGGQEGQRRLGRVEEIRKDGGGWRNEEARKDRKYKEG